MDFLCFWKIIYKFLITQIVYFSSALQKKIAYSPKFLEKRLTSSAGDELLQRLASHRSAADLLFADRVRIEV